MNRSIKIGDFMTTAMMHKAKKLIDVTADSSKWAELIDTHVIVPNLSEINRKLGQDNDPRYLAYAVVYAFTVTKESHGA